MSIRRSRPARTGSTRSEEIHLYGLHVVRTAIVNPARIVRRLSVTRNALARLDIGASDALPFPVEILPVKALDRLVSPDVAHQGVVATVASLPPPPLEVVRDCALLVVLDRVTDPRNAGAIMRTAVALGAGALVTTARYSPPESGTLAKSASGALDLIPYVRVANLVAAIERLRTLGFQTVGLDSAAPRRLENTLTSDRIALVFGAEGKGLRQRTRATVDTLARLDLPGPVRSLNVSNAAAIALHAARAHLDRKDGIASSRG